MTPLAPRPSIVGGRLAGAIYDQVKRDLLRGRFPAGTPLTVAALTAEYEVSKQPVMEAMRALAAERLVEILPQRGIQVSLFTPEEVDGFFSVFARTEGAMAHRAATKRTDAEVQVLRSVCVEMTGLESIAPSEEQARAYALGNRRVHKIIHNMARSELASDISSSLWDLSDFLIATHHPLHAMQSVTERNAGHDEVVEAIAAQDPVAAEAAMIRHVEASLVSG